MIDKMFYLIFLCILILTLSSCSESYYYPNVNTGIQAAIDDTQENFYGIDHLVIQGIKYSIVTDEYLNIVHANEGIHVLKPFANFGSTAQYTLYEIETEFPYMVLIDNKNMAYFCQDENLKDFKKHLMLSESSNSRTIEVSENENNVSLKY